MKCLSLNPVIYNLQWAFVMPVYEYFFKILCVNMFITSHITIAISSNVIARHRYSSYHAGLHRGKADMVWTRVMPIEINVWSAKR